MEEIGRIWKIDSRRGKSIQKKLRNRHEREKGKTDGIERVEGGGRTAGGGGGMVDLVCGHGFCSIICDGALNSFSLKKDGEHLAVRYGVFNIY